MHRHTHNSERLARQRDAGSTLAATGACTSSCCSCSYSSSEWAESCSCSSGTSGDVYDTCCSSSSSGGNSGRRHTWTPSCSCSVYPSCYYTTSRTSSSSNNNSGRHNIRAPVHRRNGHPTTYTFHREMLLEAPQLLRLPAAPLTSSAAVAATTPAQAEMQQQPAAAPLPLPPAEWTRGMATATAATPTRHISAHADVQQLRRSIAVQTKREGETRGTSPPPPTQRVDRGINTEFTGGEWEGQQQTLCQQTRLLQEQAQRVEALTAQRTAMEDALAAVHEKLQQQQHDTQTAITLHITTCRNSSFSELGQTEEVCRRQLQAHESDARSMLSALQQSCARAVVAAQKTCDKEAQLLHGTQALHQLQECVRRHFLLDEARRRGDVREEEQRYRLVLWRLFVVAEEGKRQSLCAAAVVAQAEEAKDAALAAQHSAEQQLREALQREKELRLQYLHVLRLPTTTVVSINPKADGTAVDAVNNRDDDMPVHVRFARAHREAVDAMNAQRIHVLGRTRIF